eukprot:TRINITY_DN17853_c0_g1_i1.p1 TRINITY_DN17853_c0_g1~~TRINITY_DN17853_c0_g1_i1.p1  ORF type:complete len:195 (-),score=44.29 TRINITY_DN17853_c0_g1_i1:356-940(-)
MALIRSPSLVFSLVLAFATCCIGAASAQDPALCPYELGYNPTFNADGSQLFCTKGTETFAVDPQGIIPGALRGIGQSFLGLVKGKIAADTPAIAAYIDRNVTFFLPTGPAGFTSPAFAAFLGSIEFPDGADTTAVFDITRFAYLDGNPRSAKVHLVIYATDFTLNTDVIFRYNIVGAKMIWQAYQAYNIDLSSP